MAESDPRNWIRKRIEAEDTKSELIQNLADNNDVTIEEIRQGLRDYPQLAGDLALARTHAPSSRLTRTLEQEYANLHRAIHRPSKNTRASFKHLCQVEIPEIAYGLRWQIYTITVGFFVAALAGYGLISTYPDLASLFASSQMINTVQQGELWTDGLLNIMPSSLISVGIFTNNIAVALTAMCLGVFFGLGTLYIIGLNGLMLGGIFAFTAHYGLAERLFTFIAAHGPVELTIIWIASAVGFSLGEALARPGLQTRAQAFQLAVSRGAKLMLLCVVFLIGAGLIEGYISPDPDYSLTVRLIVGWAYWIVLMFALKGWRFRSDADPSKTGNVA